MHHFLPRMSSPRWFAIIFLLVFIACNPDEEPVVVELYPDATSLRNQISNTLPGKDLSYFIFPSSTTYSEFPNTDPANPITKEKVELGKLLFFETALGLNPFVKDEECFEAYSCASCHIPEFGFTPGSIQGIADGGTNYGDNRAKYFKYENEHVDVQGHRPLSMVNVAYITNGMWNGMFGAGGQNIGTEAFWNDNPFAPATEINESNLAGLEAQNIEGMELHRLVVDNTVLDSLGYRERFVEAFGPNLVEEDPEMAFSFAVSAYLRSIYANQAPFQDFLKGDDNALSPEQRLGASLFFDRERTRCMNCHNLPSLGGTSFARIGTADMHDSNPQALPTSHSAARNLGRGGFTSRELDNYKFKVPQLYNTDDYATYFHGSSKKSLEDVLDYKINAISEHPMVTDDLMQLKPIEDLTDLEKNALLAFLKHGLRDPNLERYMPEELPSGNCFPNNDLGSVGNSNNNICPE